MENTLVSWTDLPAGPLWLAPPYLDARQRDLFDQLRAAVPVEPDTVWVLSSGTEGVGRLKCLGLARSAILASAAAVNAHLASDARDRWMIAIPTFLVGGFAIGARAHLSGAGVDVLIKWEPREFTRACAAAGTTLTSLVPTQIYDLVREKLRAPARLRAIVVGGGRLESALYFAARALGWPVLPSYGLTETASQIATAPLAAGAASYPELVVLDHARVDIVDGRVRIRATSLAHVRAVISPEGRVTIEDPRADGWLLTEDLAAWSERGGLKILGRGDEVVKVLGTLVSVLDVEGELRERITDPTRLIVLPVRDARREHDLVAVTDQLGSLAELARILDEYNGRAVEPRRVKRLLWVPEIPRTALGKIQRAALRAELGLS